MTPFCLSLLSAVLFSLSFSSFNLWPLAWVGLVPFFIALENKSLRFSLGIGFLTGIIFWSLTIYWLVHVTLLGQIILIVYLSLYFALFSLFVFLSKRLKKGILLVPFFWVVLEYIRSYLFTGLPWALAGFSQYRNLPVIQIAEITGAWGISFLVLFANVLIYSALKKLLKLNIILSCSFIIIISFVFGFYKLSLDPKEAKGEGFEISVVGGNIPQDIKWDRQAKEFIRKNYEELTVLAAKDKPELIIWPEAAVPALWGEDELEFKQLYSFINSQKINLLTGTVSHFGGKYYNSALFISKSGVPQLIYHKLHLVPFGEFVPLKNLFPFLESIAPVGDITPGKRYTIFEKPAPFGVLICFEDLFPELSRRFVQKGATFLVNITNDAWYKKTSAASQHLAASVFRAVENRIYLARSANTGISGFIDPYGRLELLKGRNSEEIFIKGSLKGKVYPSQGRLTFYNRKGDYFIWVALIFCFFLILPWKSKK